MGGNTTHRFLFCLVTQMKKSQKPISKKALLLIIGILVALLAGLLVLTAVLAKNEQVEETVPPVTETEPEPTETVTEAPTETVPVETEPVMLAHMAELYEMNNDIVAWVRIDGTKVDNAVVYTPEDYEKYLHLDLEGNYSYGGSIILDQRCTVDPESSNAILHGHNMKNGTMFANIMNYVNKSYWEEHPTIYYSTLYEEREYEIFAALYDRVYNVSDDVFKFYEFTDPQTEEEFNEGIEHFKENSFYEIDVTPEFGDRILILSTCSYHVDDGRLLVVAREIVEDTAE